MCRLADRAPGTARRGRPPGGRAAGPRGTRRGETAGLAAGFTLIETLVVVAVLGIMLSIAVPSYGRFLEQVRREDGRMLLRLNAQRLQRCFTLEGVYDGSCLLRTTSENGYYTLVGTPTATTYTISAVPVAGRSQAADTDCATLTYEHTGATGATGTNPDLCW